MRETRILHYGLGPIGMEAMRIVSQRSGMLSAAAVDVNPAIVERKLEELLSSGDPGGSVAVKASLVDALDDADGEVDVVVHSTGSSLPAVAPQLLECVAAGLYVVSTCEELSYPWARNAGVAGELHAAALDSGVSVLGTGVNPGFAMDYLPLVMTGVMRTVSHVSVRRVQDAATRRIPLQKKVGAGLKPEEFRRRVTAGRLGHVGLEESARAIAAGLGWHLTRVNESINPILAEVSTQGALELIERGHALGLHQVAVGEIDGRVVIELVLEMAVGLPQPRDEIVIAGDPPIRLVVEGGLPGDTATVAIVVNSISKVLSGPPGLMTMADLPPSTPCSS